MSFLTDVVKYATNILAVVAGTPRTAASVNGPLQGLVNRTAWLKVFTEYLFGPWVEIIGVDTGADTLYSPGHGLTANQAIQFRVVGGSLPAPLVGGTVYRVIVVDSDNFQVSLTSGPGPAVNLTGPMASDVYAFAIPDWIYDLLVVDAQWGTGPFADLVAWLAGAQTFTGAKTFNDITAGNGADYEYAGHAPIDIYSTEDAQAPSGGWQIYPGAYTDSAASNTTPLYIRANLPNGCTMTGFRVNYRAAAGHGGLPQFMPKLQLVTRSTTGTLEVVVATATDSSPSVGAFETNHTIQSAAFALGINTTLGSTHWWKFTAENGTNATPNGLVLTPIATVIPAAVDPGAGT